MSHGLWQLHATLHHNMITQRNMLTIVQQRLPQTITLTPLFVPLPPPQHLRQTHTVCATPVITGMQHQHARVSSKAGALRRAHKFMLQAEARVRGASSNPGRSTDKPKCRKGPP